MDKIYLTTTLPYANSVPHVGHAIEFFQADAFARFFRRKLGAENVFFNVGVDEHGLKLYSTAQAAGKEPRAFLDELVPKWLDFCGKFRISFDRFYRTSDPDHHAAAKRVWELCDKKGDIYKKHYSGRYCVGCEAFLLDKDLVDGKCPDHGTAPADHSEENYFFKLSSHGDAILRYMEGNPGFIRPLPKTQELANFIKGMEDISISRSRANLPWGIEVPGDPGHVIYVWFDALVNYIRTIGFDTDMAMFNRWWPGVQLCGPDNLRFQGAIWQGMLASLGLPFTRTILVHGTILGPDGQKMSKTLGNVVAPLEQYEKYGSDICRFYMLGMLRPYTDCSYKEEDLKAGYQSHLANNYGNLLSRLVHLAATRNVEILSTGAAEAEFRAKVMEARAAAEAFYGDYDIFSAVARTNELITFGNRYVQEKEPWRKGDAEAAVILANVSLLVQEATALYEPVIPDGAAKAMESIRTKTKIVLYPRLALNP